MAQGDVIADTTDLATESYYAIQPGAGESYIIDDFFASSKAASTKGYGQYYDGTDAGPAFFVTSASAADFYSWRVDHSQTHQETMFHINNDLYWRVYNADDVAAHKCGLVAIQIQ